jgi:hypothetical protein
MSGGAGADKRSVRRVVLTVGALVSAVALLLAVTAASLIGLNAECNGAAGECPRSDAYRFSLLAMPIAAAIVLVVGGVFCVRKRALWPLFLAEAAVLAIDALTGGFVEAPDLGTALWLGLAILIGWLALRHRHRSA